MHRIAFVTTHYGIGGAGMAVENLSRLLLSKEESVCIDIHARNARSHNASKHDRLMHHVYPESAIRRFFFSRYSWAIRWIFEPDAFFSLKMPSLRLTLGLLRNPVDCLVLCYVGEGFIPWLPIIRQLRKRTKIIQRLSDYHVFFDGCHFEDFRSCKNMCKVCPRVRSTIMFRLLTMSFGNRQRYLNCVDLFIFRDALMMNHVVDLGLINNSKARLLLPLTDRKMTSLSSVACYDSHPCQISFVSSRINDPRKGFKEAACLFSELLNSSKIPYELHAFGDSLDANSYPSVFYHGSSSQNHICATRKEFLFHIEFSPPFLDNCPNTLIEALIEGLTVIYKGEAPFFASLLPPGTFIKYDPWMMASCLDSMHKVASMSNDALSRRKRLIGEEAFRLFNRCAYDEITEILLK